MQSLGYFLDQLHAEYHRPEHLSSDPLEFVHRYEDPWDQEVVALIAALLAYGNVKQIRRSVADLLNRMSFVARSPAEFVRRLEDPAFSASARSELRKFVHRFNVGDDLMILLLLLSRSWKEHRSLGAHFISLLSPEDADITDALSRLIAEWKKSARALSREHAVPLRESFGYLLTSPADGSCCKRWCMFLRWMGRADRLDPGLWTEGGALAGTFPAGCFLRASQLVIPLDTHTGRISQYLGLTERKSLNWKAAVEVTTALRQANSGDPTRYDFALSRLGILDLCQRRYREEVCSRCQLEPACRFAMLGRSKGKAKPAPKTSRCKTS